MVSKLIAVTVVTSGDVSKSCAFGTAKSVLLRFLEIQNQFKSGNDKETSTLITNQAKKMLVKTAGDFEVL